MPMWNAKQAAGACTLIKQEAPISLSLLSPPRFVPAPDVTSFKMLLAGGVELFVIMNHYNRRSQT